MIKASELPEPIEHESQTRRASSDRVVCVQVWDCSHRHPGVTSPTLQWPMACEIYAMLQRCVPVCA